MRVRGMSVVCGRLDAARSVQAILKPAWPKASVSAAAPDARHLERVGLLRVLLGLDHDPAR